MLFKVVSVTHQFKVLALLRCSGCTAVVPEMLEAVAQVVHHFYTRFENTHKFIPRCLSGVKYQHSCGI